APVTVVPATAVPVPATAPEPGGPAPSEVTTEQVVGPVGRLEVASDAGGITVTGTDDGAVTVTRSIYRDPVAPVEVVRHEGDLLHIESQCPPDSQQAGPCRIDYDITVPRGTVVTIAGASGDLATSGLTGPLTARSASGSIRVGEHQSATTTAESASGDVTVHLGTRPVTLEATSTSGNVQVTLPDAGPYRVAADTVTGRTDVGVRSDPGARSTIRVRTTSGDVSVGTG
ncbi:MAG TPA: DUF4097 family beta strand repeat-containing protein, partial [Pseudonocardia sp.]|nr:DUF4097 family beta strand repeat-containing protein [Pseudonocardia sp.]